MNYLISNDNLKEAESVINQIIIMKEDAKAKALELGDDASLFMTFSYDGIFRGMEKIIEMFDIKSTFADNKYIITSDEDCILTYEREKILRNYIEQDKKDQENNLNDLKKSTSNEEKFDIEMKIYSCLTVYFGMSLFADKLGLIIDESEDINNMLSISNGLENAKLSQLESTISTFNTVLISKLNSLSRTQEIAEKLSSLNNKKKQTITRLGQYLDSNYIEVATKQVDVKIEALNAEKAEVIKNLYLAEEKIADIFEKLLRSDKN